MFFRLVVHLGIFFHYRKIMGVASKFVPFHLYVFAEIFSLTNRIGGRISQLTHLSKHPKNNAGLYIQPTLNLMKDKGDDEERASPLNACVRW